MMKFKYQSGDGFTLVYTGIIGVLSAMVMLLIGIGFDVVVFGVLAYSVLLFLSMSAFFVAYAVRDRQVDELTAVQDDRQSRLDDIIRVERYYTEIFKEVE
jgi:uncharacterized membrane protein